MPLEFFFLKQMYNTSLLQNSDTTLPFSLTLEGGRSLFSTHSFWEYILTFYYLAVEGSFQVFFPVWRFLLKTRLQCFAFHYIFLLIFFSLIILWVYMFLANTDSQNKLLNVKGNILLYNTQLKGPLEIKNSKWKAT